MLGTFVSAADQSSGRRVKAREVCIITSCNREMFFSTVSLMGLTQVMNVASEIVIFDMYFLPKRRNYFQATSLTKYHVGNMRSAC